ncbi:MAG: hemerythrin domain-containing protein [Candidatus Binatia bacterium]
MRHPSLVSLSHDHHHGLALALRCRKQALGQIKPTGLEGLRERAKEVCQFFSSSLAAHFRAEEEVLFPRLQPLAPGSEAIITGLLSEHEEIRRSIALLETEGALAKLMFDIGDLLERHIRKEERELFPLFEQHVKDEEAEAVGSEIKKILAAPAAKISGA